MTLTSDLVLRNIVSGAYLILFEIGIPNLVCGILLGWWSVAYLFGSLSPFVSSLIFFEVGIPYFPCKCILGWWSVTYHFQATVTLTSDLVLRIIVSGAYLLYYLK